MLHDILCVFFLFFVYNFLNNFQKFYYHSDYPAVDVNNIGKGKGGGSCTAAAFLKVILFNVYYIQAFRCPVLCSKLEMQGAIEVSTN